MLQIDRADAVFCGCDAPQKSGALISIDEALARIAAAAAPVAGTETLGSLAAQGRVLAEPVRSRAAVPPFDNAAMDGYAVDTAALKGMGPWVLPVSGRVPAGQLPQARLAGPVAQRIFTGAPLPRGADAVVMQEDVARIGDTIRLGRRPVPGDHIRRAGEDMAKGQTVLASGRRLGPREIAAAAAAGAGMLRVRRRPRVALLVTGDEIRQAGCDLAPAHIWDVNTPMLGAALLRHPVDLVAADLGADSLSGLQRQLESLSGNVDLVVTSGGISVGEEDHVKPALAALGCEILFSGVAMKPGKPVSFGRLGAAHWLGLPGNPLSAFVTWQIFGPALLRALSGETGAAASVRHVVIRQPIRRRPGRCELRPARIAGFDEAGREVVDFEEATHSGRVAGLPESDGLMVLPAESDRLPAGALVEFRPFCAD